MWCDGFDADLLALVPGAADALGAAGGTELTTRSRTDGGAINHPSCWHTDFGIAAFFWTREAFRSPPEYVTEAPLARCTLLEAIRDEWVHGCLVVVDRVITWRPPQRAMEQLMADRRGYRPLAGPARAELHATVLAGLHLAAVTLEARL